ncbi:MAG: polymerase, sigma 54 subunit, RpoN [Gammaproteobacteria bacterium]|jgi:RNA polymerase sigma-54 factor|nr:polymerase, sigma 54 subunit, RpoN [Gammaproteobacteria bacterium]
MISQSLNIGTTQQLQLTPRLQKAIHMLQLSSQELTQEIQNILESNILLEPADTCEATDVPDAYLTKVDPEESILENGYGSDDDVSVDWSSAETNYSKANNDLDQTGLMQNRAVQLGSGLQSYLLSQLQLSSLPEEDSEICEMIIDSINDNGFLETSLEELQQVLQGMDRDVTLNKIEMLLSYVQALGPVGVGARDLKESLLLQLNALPATTPELSLAQALIKTHLSLLAEHNYQKLARIYKVEIDELKTAIMLIQSLTPRPGRAIATSDLEQIVPDVIVRRKNDSWEVALNKRTLPKLQLNHHYIAILDQSSDASESQFINHHLQEARWLIKCLQNRNETLLKVASCIVRHQQAFFKHGPGAMKPLVLKDVAEDIGMHPSTISRITTRKYMQTPQGTFELKYFFTSQLNTSYGQQCSARAIQTYIKDMIRQEDSTKPLSDEAIAKKLLDQGIQVARRTVAKYRELLGIEPASRRKKLLKAI